MEGRPFGAADFPLDPYFLLTAAVAWIGIRGPRRSFPPCLLWQHQHTSIQIDEVRRQVVHLTSWC